MTKPNILFIMTDEQKYDTLSFVNPTIHTPNLDALIEQSVFFNNAYCSNPSCVPSRAAIMTGKYPTVCQCPTYISMLPDTEKTYMTRLQESGYYTAVVGKQHFAGATVAKGYDYECIVDGHFPTTIPEDIGAYLDFLKEEGVTDLAALSDDSLIVGGKWLGKVEHHIDHFIGEKGRTWLAGHIDKTKNDPDAKPWYMTLSFPGPHQPFDGEGTPYADQYDLADMAHHGATSEARKTKPPHFEKLNPLAYVDNYDEETFLKTKRSYYANMSMIDAKVGEVIQMLREKGVYDNTVIIYSTDHGDFMGEFGLTTKAQYLSEALMRVPLFVKPAIKDFKGVCVDDYVTNIDIASTCLSQAGAVTQICDGMENHPYDAYWSDAPVTPRDHLFLEAHNMKAIIEQGIKTIYYVNRPYGELYDLNKDPYETINLWDDAAYQSHKLHALGRIIDQMFVMSPKSKMRWNTKAPEI